MKTSILSFTILLWAVAPSFAQLVFAPAGSSWYRTMQYGTFHNYNAGDTIINGTACRKIVRVAHTADPAYSQGLRVYDHATLYVYNNADTVFVYNQLFQRFTPLYVFNVSDGDVVRLPILPLDHGTLTFISTDSTFSFRVDSVRMKRYDTAMLRTVYIHPLGNSTTNYVYSYSSNADTPGAYAERIGSIAYGMVPAGKPAAYLATDLAQPEGALRCYEDASVAIKLTTGICDISPVAVAALAPEGQDAVFPNPARDELTIPNASRKSCDLVIKDMSGRVVLTHTYDGSKEAFKVPLAKLAPGNYTLKLAWPDRVIYRKISVVR